MRIIIALTFVLSLVMVGTALAEMDSAGNIIGGGSIPGSPGDPCGTCPRPGFSLGLDFQGTDMITLDNSVIYILQSCTVVGQVQITPAPQYGFEIGWDSSRDLYVICDPSADRVHQINTSGVVVATFPSPGPGPVGIAYDPSRDVYWVTDWETNRIMSMDAATGTPGQAWPAPQGSRIAGTGYDPEHDALVYHGRDQGLGYWISAADGHFITSYVVPNAGQNNGNGVGVDPTTLNAWLVNYESTDLYCVEGLGSPTATEPLTWGHLKSLYR